jgi:hypothetical protein
MDSNLPTILRQIDDNEGEILLLNRMITDDGENMGQYEIGNIRHRVSELERENTQLRQRLNALNSETEQMMLQNMMLQNTPPLKMTNLGNPRKMTNLQGGYNNYQQKYLKYKQKYMKLKKYMLE